ERYGSGEVRLTNRQDLIIVNVPQAALPELLAEPLLARYQPNPPVWLRRSVSCTGRDFCQFALIDTKGSAVEFARRMEELLPLADAPRVHWSGCHRACGQHHIADIGLVASRS